MYPIESKKIIHVYIDQTNEPIPRIFYVGKGNIRRIKDNHRNKKHDAIMNRFGMTRVIVLETFDEEFANLVEKMKIIECGTLARGYHVCDEDFGSNFTAGGEGFSGVFDEERKRRKEKMESRWKDNDERKRLTEIQNGESVKMKKSNAMKEWLNSDAGREHIRNSLELARNSITREARVQGQNRPETKKLKSEIMKNFCDDEKVKKFKSENAKKFWESEEYREKQKESRKNFKMSDSTKKAISDKLRGHSVSEETRAKIREAVRLAHLKKKLIDPEQA